MALRKVTKPASETPSWLPSRSHCCINNCAMAGRGFLGEHEKVRQADKRPVYLLKQVYCHCESILSVISHKSLQICIKKWVHVVWKVGIGQILFQELIPQVGVMNAGVHNWLGKTVRILKEYGCVMKHNFNSVYLKIKLLILLVSYMKNTYQGQLIYGILSLRNDSEYSLSNICCSPVPIVAVCSCQTPDFRTQQGNRPHFYCHKIP